MRPPEAEDLLVAAQEVLREQGLAAVTVAAVLERTELGTRAFYRHFTSKDHLLVEVFADATRAEVERLRLLMDGADGPVDSVAAWVEGRLALAFDALVESDLRHLSQQAQALYAVAPAVMADLYAALLLPLVDQVRAGQEAGAFAAGDPVLAAQSVASVVWAAAEREWVAPSKEPDQVRAETLAFCLRGLGPPRDQG